MTKIVSLAAALAVGLLAAPAFAQSAAPSDTKVQTDVQKPEHAPKDKSVKATKHEQVAQHPGDSAADKTSETPAPTSK
jgi:hypothetical protein